MVDRLVILRDDIPVLRILILEIIILIIREIIIVEYGIKTLILRNLMVPIRFGGISFLTLVVIPVTDHILHLLPFRVEYPVVNASIPAIIHQMIQAMHGDPVFRGKIIVYFHIRHMYVRTSRGIIIHLRPVFSGRGRFAERSFPVFPPIIVFRIDMEFSGMQIQYRSCVISLIPSRPKRNI